MNENQLLEEAIVMDDKAATLEERLALAKEKLQEAETEIVDIALAAAKLKIDISAAKLTHTMATVFEQAHNYRAVIRRLILESVGEEKAEETKQRLGNYGVKEKDLQDAVLIFEEKFNRFVKDIIREILVRNNNVKKVLQSADEMTLENFSSSLEQENRKIYEYFRPRIFDFETITFFDDRAVQKIIRDVDEITLARAIKDSSPRVKNKFLNNMSKNAQKMIEETMDYMGPIRKKDVLEAKEEIRKAIFRLENSGDIVLAL